MGRVTRTSAHVETHSGASGASLTKGKAHRTNKPNITITQKVFTLPRLGAGRPSHAVRARASSAHRLRDGAQGACMPISQRAFLWAEDFGPPGFTLHDHSCAPVSTSKCLGAATPIVAAGRTAMRHAGALSVTRR